MKKTYINPELQVVKMKINQHLLDGSPNGLHEEQGSGSILGHENEFDFDSDF